MPKLSFILNGKKRNSDDEKNTENGVRKEEINISRHWKCVYLQRLAGTHENQQYFNIRRISDTHHATVKTTTLFIYEFALSFYSISIQYIKLVMCVIVFVSLCLIAKMRLFTKYPTNQHQLLLNILFFFLSTSAWEACLVCF